MTDDQLQGVKDDIAYMRSMAQEGRKTPLLGGSILILAGGVFGLASLAHYLIVSGVVAASDTAFAVIWLGAMAVFTVGLIALNLRIGRKPGYFSPVNKASGAAWMGVGLTIFFMFLSLAVMAWRTQDAAVMNIFPSLIFALYGAGWAVSGRMSGVRWMGWLAIGCWLAAPLIAFLTGQPEQYLAYAAGLFLFAAVPGVLMVRQEPAEVI